MSYQDHVTGLKTMLQHRNAVHTDPVSTLQIRQRPMFPVKTKFAMAVRNGSILHLQITIDMPSQNEGIF